MPHSCYSPHLSIHSHLPVSPTSLSLALLPPLLPSSSISLPPPPPSRLVPASLSFQPPPPFCLPLPSISIKLPQEEFVGDRHVTTKFHNNLQSISFHLKPRTPIFFCSAPQDLGATPPWGFGGPIARIILAPSTYSLPTPNPNPTSPL